MRPFLFMLAMLATLGGCAANSSDPLAIPVQPVLSTRLPHAPLPAKLILPDGPGPFPVVILLHGCGGIGRGTQLNAWAARLSDWGYGALIVNSFAPRNIASVCAPADQPRSTPYDRAGDVINAALFLQRQPRVDPNRIGVIGFSHGGHTATTVARAMFIDLHPGLLKAIVDYYGACQRPDLNSGVPLLALAGEDDTWGDPARTCKAFAAALQPDQHFEVVTYPGTVHAFDSEAQLLPTMKEGHPMQYNPKSAADSFVRVHAFLDRWLKPND